MNIATLLILEKCSLALIIPSDSSAIHELAVSSDLHWLACVDCNNTLNIFSLTKLKVLSFFLFNSFFLGTLAVIFAKFCFI